MAPPTGRQFACPRSSCASARKRLYRERYRSRRALALAECHFAYADQYTPTIDDNLTHGKEGVRSMTSGIQLEPEAQAFAEAAARPPLPFTPGPEQGRLALEECYSVAQW